MAFAESSSGTSVVCAKRLGVGELGIARHHLVARADRVEGGAHPQLPVSSISQDGLIRSRSRCRCRYRPGGCGTRCSTFSNDKLAPRARLCRAEHRLESGIGGAYGGSTVGDRPCARLRPRCSKPSRATRIFSRMTTTSIPIQAPSDDRSASVGARPLSVLAVESRVQPSPDALVASNRCPGDPRELDSRRRCDTQARLHGAPKTKANVGAAEAERVRKRNGSSTYVGRRDDGRVVVELGVEWQRVRARRYPAAA